MRRYFTSIFAALYLITGRNELSLEVRNEQYRKLMAKGLEFFHETPIIKSAIEQLPNKTIYHGWLFVEGEMWIYLWRMYPIGSQERKDIFSKVRDCIVKYGMEGKESDCYYSILEVIEKIALN